MTHVARRAFPAHQRVRRARAATRAAAAAVLTLASALIAVPTGPALAQLPTIPVLQNGFAGAGLTVAANYGSTSGSSAYALAASWGPNSRRFQLSGGIGAVRPGSGSTWTGYGGRVSLPVFSAAEGRFGVAAFGGVGGARRDTTSIVRVPIGVGVGYRFPIGGARSISAYGAPFFVWSRVSEKGARGDGDNGVRGSLGLDLVITRSIGLTAGYEFGDSGPDVAPGGSSGVFGAAVSYAFR